MKPKLFAEAARQRLHCRPAAVESPAVLQAKVDFFEAVVSRNAVEAKRAVAVMERHTLEALLGSRPLRRRSKTNAPPRL